MRFYCHLYPKKLLAAFIFLFISFYAAFAGGITSGPAPAWVSQTKADWNATVAPNEIEAGYYYLLYDQQDNVQTSEYYIRIARKVVNQSGIEKCSQLLFSYDKAFESVVIHTVNIIRGGRVINQLDLGKLKVVQKTKEMDMLQYTETMSGMLFLEDVRAGDIIDYSYTLTSANPLFTQKFAYTLDLQYGLPICLMNYRIISPLKRELHIKVLNDGAQPDEKIERGRRIYTWYFKDLAAMKLDDGLPSGFAPSPVAEISEYNNWDEVRQWGRNLYAGVMTGGTGVRAKAKELMPGCQTNGDTIISMLRFVQDQIKYLGIETGINTHKPHSPEQVLAQGFGDCKDKTTLFCALLNEAGIKAYPVLIKTPAPDDMQEFLPSPNIFNHVCAAVEYQGEYRFFDPTISYQRGRIDNTYFPHYKYGLVLDGKSGGLTALPFNPDLCGTSMVQKFIVGDSVSPTTLTVQSTFTGRDADNFREGCASGSFSDLQKTYLNYYAGIYKNVQVLDSVKVTSDDSAANKITTTEEYSINDFWQHNAGKVHEWQLSFWAENLKRYVTLPKSRNRTMPIGVIYPVNYEERFEITMPRQWKAKNESTVVDDSVFRFSFESSYSESERTIYLNYSLVTKTNSSKAEFNKQYFNDADKIRDNLGYNIYINASTSTAGNKTISLFMLFLFAATCIGTGLVCWYIYNKYDIQTEYTGQPAEGFGGWLILPVIGSCLNPVAFLFSFFITDRYLNRDVLDILFDKSAVNYFPPLGYILIAQLFMRSVVISLSIFNLVLLFKKRSIFPRFFIGFVSILWFSEVINWLMINSGLVHGLQSNPVISSNLFRVTVYCAIWIPYMLKSERVKQTFTNFHPSRTPVVMDNTHAEEIEMPLDETGNDLDESQAHEPVLTSPDKPEE